MNKREKELLEHQLKAEEKELHKLKKIYSDALKRIDDNIANLLGRADADMQHVIYRVDYQRALRGQINGILDELNSNQFASITEYMASSYTNGYVGAFYNMAGEGIPIITPIDQKQVVKAMRTDTKISESLYTKLGKDTNEMKKRIADTLSRGIATGQGFNEIARNIANESNIGFNKAVRIARTEGARIYNTASYDACAKAKEKGADVVKQWNSTLDGKTRPSHRRVDGEIRELDEKFSNGLMFPSDPKGSAEDVINCRCALMQRAKWNLDEEELETLKQRAEYFKLDKTENFEDYKKKYLRGAEVVKFENNPLVMFEMPPVSWEYKTAEEYWDARTEYREKHPDYDDYYFYVDTNDSRWTFERTPKTVENAKRFDATVYKLRNQYPLPNDDLKIGTYSEVQYFLNDTQKSRIGDDGAAQHWINPDTGMNIIAFRPQHSKGTLADDLSIRQKALDTGQTLSMVLANSSEGTAIHEWGHAMSEYVTKSYARGDESTAEYWEWYKSLTKEEIAEGVSKYATINRGEFEAECFAELSTGNPRPIAKKYGEYLTKASSGVINFDKSVAETLENVGKSSKIVLSEGQKKAYTKIKVEDIPSMDEKRFAQIKANLEKQGIAVIQDADGDDYLAAMGAEAMTLSDGSAVIFQSKRVPSASAVFEEVIHTSQIKTSGMVASRGTSEDSEDVIEYLHREIEANEKLLQHIDSYGLTTEDVESVRENLKKYREQLKGLE